MNAHTTRTNGQYLTCGAVVMPDKVIPQTLAAVGSLTTFIEFGELFAGTTRLGPFFPSHASAKQARIVGPSFLPNAM